MKILLISMGKAFMKIESDLKKYFYIPTLLGLDVYANMGTSALSILIKNDEIYCANLGDSKAMIFNEQKGNNNILFDKINRIKQKDKLSSQRKQ